jgi:hypothetical protein
VELTARFGTVSGTKEWTALWRAQASWLKGSKVNAVKAERLVFFNSVKKDLKTGRYHRNGCSDNGNVEQKVGLFFFLSFFSFTQIYDV